MDSERSVGGSGIRGQFGVVVAVALVVTANILLTQSGPRAPGDIGNAKESAQVTDDRSTPLEQSDDDDYDVGLEEPVIEGSRPTSLQEFAEDARTPGAGEPRVVGPEPGSVTFPSAARLIE